MVYALRVSCFISVVLLSGLVAFAQGSRPSPSPQSSSSPPVIEGNLDNWKEFTSDEGGFKVLMPSIPTHTSSAVDTALGPLMIHAYVLETKFGRLYLGYTDFPLPSDDPEVVRQVLNGGRDQVLSGGGKLLNEKDVSLDGVVGRELIVDKDRRIFRARMFVIKGRLYQAVIGAAPEFVFKDGKASANASDRADLFENISAKFFGSFKIIPASERLGEVDILLRSEVGKNIVDTCDPKDLRCKSLPGKLTLVGITLPQPPYPAIAQAAHASGTVVVKVVVDEGGKVIAAQAVRGHPLLQAVSVIAARQARFAPALLRGKPVKVVGVLSYNFAPK